MTLEPAQCGDREAVNALAVQVNDLHASWCPELYRHTDEMYTREVFSQDLAEKSIYVMRRNGKTVAYIRVRVGEWNGSAPDARKILYLEEICVDEAQRHQGIGKQIMSDVKVLARELGCTELRLSAVPQNTAAIALYEHAGLNVRMLNYNIML